MPPLKPLQREEGIMAIFKTVKLGRASKKESKHHQRVRETIARQREIREAFAQQLDAAPSRAASRILLSELGQGLMDQARLLSEVWCLLRGLSYDGRASFLASLVAFHALENADPENTAWDEAGAVASAAREIIVQARGETAEADHAPRS